MSGKDIRILLTEEQWEELQQLEIESGNYQGESYKDYLEREKRIQQ